MTLLKLGDIRNAFYTALNTGTLQGKVFKHIKKDQALPFVKLGKLRRKPWDTMGENGYEVTQTIAIVDDSENFTNVDTMLEAVEQNLQSLAITGWNVIIDETSVTDSDEEGLQYPYTMLDVRLLVSEQ